MYEVTFDLTRDFFLFFEKFFTFLNVFADLLFSLVVMSLKKRFEKRFDVEKIKELKLCKKSLKKVFSKIRTRSLIRSTSFDARTIQRKNSAEKTKKKCIFNERMTLLKKTKKCDENKCEKKKIKKM